MNKKKEKMIVTAEVPVSLALEARIAASKQNKSRSQLIREALEIHLTRLKKKRTKKTRKVELSREER